MPSVFPLPCSSSPAVSRRVFLRTVAAALVTTTTAEETPAPVPALRTRGVVLYPFDLSLRDWPERCARAGLTTIALHAAQRLDVLIDFIQSDDGLDFLERCRKLGLAVEYELHALGQLLSRELFYKDPTLFRLDETGRRNPDSNCNPFSKEALDLIAAQAVRVAKILQPTTHRYFYWPDDGAKWDHSDLGKELSASDQALLVENHIVRALRREVDPQATLAHLSYQHTLTPPRQIQPEPGIFLEFAPFARNLAHPITADVPTRRGETSPDPATNTGYLDLLAANLQVFPAETAQVLDYWLDVSLHSNWQRPAQPLPWKPEVCRADADAYRRLGIRHLTSFATYMDADYAARHGDPQPVLESYGQALVHKA